MDAKSLFQILIRENSDMLVAYLRSGVRDPHAVDDLYQEIALTAWKLNSDDREKPIGSWLRGIAGRLLHAYYRKTSKSAKPLDEQTPEWLNDRFAAIHSPTSAMPGDTLDEKLAALRECVDALPEVYQRPITMGFTEQRGLSEIATALNLARDTLKKRLSRGNSKLADCLDCKLRLAGATS